MFTATSLIMTTLNPIGIGASQSYTVLVMLISSTLRNNIKRGK